MTKITCKTQRADLIILGGLRTRRPGHTSRNLHEDPLPSLEASSNCPTWSRTPHSFLRTRYHCTWMNHQQVVSGAECEYKIGAKGSQTKKIWAEKEASKSLSKDRDDTSPKILHRDLVRTNMYLGTLEARSLSKAGDPHPGGGWKTYAAVFYCGDAAGIMHIYFAMSIILEANNAAASGDWPVQ